jgi:hypothetical protein
MGTFSRLPEKSGKVQYRCIISADPCQSPMFFPEKHIAGSDLPPDCMKDQHT